MAIDKKGIGTFIGTSLFSIAAGWYGQPLIHENSDAVGVIVNVFSILAGFLVTIITILGDPGVFRGRTWRSEQVKRSNMFRRLTRHKYLFKSYLVVLLLIFVTTLVTDKNPDSLAAIWLERTFLAIACFAFIMSMMLPRRLMDIQLSRFDEMVEARKNPNSDKDNSLG